MKYYSNKFLYTECADCAVIGHLILDFPQVEIFY